MLEAISLHKQEILRLKRLANTLRPISRLPPELLCDIFLRQAEEFQKETLLQWHPPLRRSAASDILVYAHKAVYAWTSVALVCRHWREVVLKCAKLWTFLALDGRVPATYQRTVLQRSQGLPLTVVMHAFMATHCAGCTPKGGDTAVNYVRALELLVEVLPNTRRLVVFIGEDDYSSINSALCNGAGKLQSLHVEAVGWRTRSWNRDARSVQLPANIFSPELPPLQSLSVSTIGFSWHEVLLRPTLRHLKVTKCKFPPANSWWFNMVSALRGMPMLETFEIDAHSLREPDGSFRCEPVPLSNLRSVKLPLTNPSSARFISVIQFPSTTSVHFVDVREDIFPDETVEATADAILALLRDTAVYAISRTGYSRRDWKHSTPPHTCLWAGSSTIDGPPDLQHVIGRTPPRIIVDSDTALTAILRALDLRHVSILAMEDDTFSPPRWADLLMRAENVSTILLYGKVSFGVGAALVGWRRPDSMNQGLVDSYGRPIEPEHWVGFGDVPDEELIVQTPPETASPGQETTGAVSVRFPRLSTLRIQNVDFVAPPGTSKPEYRYYRPPDRYPYHAGGTPFGLDDKGLARSLRMRVRLGGTPIERLEFDDCECHERQRLTPLLESVSELWWDGEKVSAAGVEG